MKYNDGTKFNEMNGKIWDLCHATYRLNRQVEGDLLFSDRERIARRNWRGLFIVVVQLRRENREARVFCRKLHKFHVQSRRRLQGLLTQYFVCVCVCVTHIYNGLQVFRYRGKRFRHILREEKCESIDLIELKTRMAIGEKKMKEGWRGLKIDKSLRGERKKDEWGSLKWRSSSLTRWRTIFEVNEMHVYRSRIWATRCIYLDGEWIVDGIINKY